MTTLPSGLTIGELARHTGVGVETIRFYERCGLVAPPERPAGGYRRYSAEAASRLGFIQRAKQLGFTLRETEELLSLGEAPGATRAEVEERALHKLEDIDARIRGLGDMRAQLAALVETCDGSGQARRCSMLAAIGNGPAADPFEGEKEHHGQ